MWSYFIAETFQLFWVCMIIPKPCDLWGREVAKARSSMSDGRCIAGMALLSGDTWRCLFTWPSQWGLLRCHWILLNSK